MPNIGPLEIVIILIIALIVFGPKRLPELGRSMGKGMREFKNSLTSDKDDDDDDVRELERTRRGSRGAAARGRGRSRSQVVARWRVASAARPLGGDGKSSAGKPR